MRLSLQFSHREGFLLKSASYRGKDWYIEPHYKLKFGYDKWHYKKQAKDSYRPEERYL